MDYDIAFGMLKDGSEVGLKDDWRHYKDGLLTQIFLLLPRLFGLASNQPCDACERLYAYSADTNDRGQSICYGKTGGCLVTGNERRLLQTLCNGYTICTATHWLYDTATSRCWMDRRSRSGPSYGDEVENNDTPTGFDNEFTSPKYHNYGLESDAALNLKKMQEVYLQLETLKMVGKKVTNAEQYKLLTSHDAHGPAIVIR